MFSIIKCLKSPQVGLSVTFCKRARVTLGYTELIKWSISLCVHTYIYMISFTFPLHFLGDSIFGNLVLRKDAKKYACGFNVICIKDLVLKCVRLTQWNKNRIMCVLLH